MRRRNFLIFVAVSVLGLGLDWGTKALAVAHLPASDIVVNDRSVSPLLLLAVLAVALTLILVVKTRLISFAMGLVTAGWLGNCLDRNLRGPVTDFIKVPGGDSSYQNYCNIADLMLLASVPLMALALYIWMRKRAGQARPTTDACSASSRLLLVICMAGVTWGLDWGATGIFGRLLAPSELVRDAHMPSRVLLVGLIILIPFAWSAVRTRWGCVGLGLVIGGLVANLSELVLRGSVLDFIHLPRVGSTIVVTNLAGLAIAGGALLILQASILEIWGRRPNELRSD